MADMFGNCYLYKMNTEARNTSFLVHTTGNEFTFEQLDTLRKLIPRHVLSPGANWPVELRFDMTPEIANILRVINLRGYKLR
jgi:hypothetical protein